MEAVAQLKLSYPNCPSAQQPYEKTICTVSVPCSLDKNSILNLRVKAADSQEYIHRRKYDYV